MGHQRAADTEGYGDVSNGTWIFHQIFKNGEPIFIPKDSKSPRSEFKVNRDSGAFSLLECRTEFLPDVR